MFDSNKALWVAHQAGYETGGHVGRHMGGTARKHSTCLDPGQPDESEQAETASLFPVDNPLSPHQRRIFALLKADEATHIDEIVDRLETEMSSSESSQLFRIGASGKSEAIAGGRIFVKTF